jgi:hypothetical protein
MCNGTMTNNLTLEGLVKSAETMYLYVPLIALK